MAKIFDTGRVCVKTHGRYAGKYCVVTKVIDDSFVEITGPKSLNGLKRKKSNIKHIIPTKITLDIKNGATDDEIKKAIESKKLKDMFTSKVS